MARADGSRESQKDRADLSAAPAVALLLPIRSGGDVRASRCRQSPIRYTTCRLRGRCGAVSCRLPVLRYLSGPSIMSARPEAERARGAFTHDEPAARLRACSKTPGTPRDLPWGRGRRQPTGYLMRKAFLFQLAGLHFVAHPPRSRAAPGPLELGVFFALILCSDLAPLELRALSGATALHAIADTRFRQR
jgi:hypothetical protein